MRKHISAFVVMLLVMAGAFFALAVTTSPATAADPEFSTDPDNPTLVTEVPEGFTALGDPTVTEDDCITTTEQVYSMTTTGEEGETQTTGWLTEPPEGEGWTQIDQRTVTDSEAIPASFGEWSGWSVFQNGLLAEPTLDSNTDVREFRLVGPVSVGNGDATEDHYINLQWFVYTGQLDGTPEREDENWHPVPALPNGLPHDPAIGGIYNVSHSDNGRGSWFKYDGDFVPGTPETFHNEWSIEERTRTFTPGVDAVTHEEFMYERTLTGTEDITEYVYTSVTEGEPCEEEPPVEEPPTEEPPVEEPPVNTPPVNTPDVPTSIDAGLSGPTAEQDDTMRASLLVGSGLLVMLAAGLALINQRRVGTEQ